MFGQCGDTRRKIEGSKALMGSSIGPKLENVPLRAIGTRKMEMLWTVSGHICGGDVQMFVVMPVLYNYI